MKNYNLQTATAYSGAMMSVLKTTKQRRRKDVFYH